MRIGHKSHYGVVDLTLYSMKPHLNKAKKKIGPMLDDDMKILVTSKSVSVRLAVPIVKFDKAFDSQLSEIKRAFDAVERLYELSNLIEYDEILGGANIL